MSFQRLSFWSLLASLFFASGSLLGQEGQSRRFFREYGISLLTPSENNPEWRQKNGQELPPGNLWAGQSRDQTHSLTLRVAESQGDQGAFAQGYAQRLEQEVGRIGLKLSQAEPTSLGPWAAWRMEFSGTIAREEASQITWLIAANNRVYDLSCLVGGTKAAQDPIVAGFAKGFEFISLPSPAPSPETWAQRTGSGIRWVTALCMAFLCGGMGMYRNRPATGWSWGAGSVFLGLAGTWWWSIPATVVGIALLSRKWSHAGEVKLEMIAFVFATFAVTGVIIRTIF